MFKFLETLFKKPSSELGKALENGAIIIDVRSPAEFSQGHIQSSKNIPLNEIKQKTEMIRKWNKPVIVVCQSGNRSQLAKSVLAASGIEVYNGGAWSYLKNNYENRNFQ